MSKADYDALQEEMKSLRSLAGELGKAITQLKKFTNVSVLSDNKNDKEKDKKQNNKNVTAELPKFQDEYLQLIVESLNESAKAKEE